MNRCTTNRCADCEQVVCICAPCSTCGVKACRGDHTYAEACRAVSDRHEPLSTERMEKYCLNHGATCRCDMCRALASRRTEQKEREMEKRVTHRELMYKETSFITNAKNHISMKFESNGDKDVHTLVIDATNSYVLSKTDIADLVSILKPYVPPAVRERGGPDDR